MRIVVTGSGGQLGSCLSLVAQHPDYSDVELYPLSRSQLDLAHPGAGVDLGGVDVVINAAAYTAVDQAEKEPERAHAVNATGAGWLAQRCARQGVHLIHVSTDYVFGAAPAGAAGGGPRPWREDDPTRPINVYGASKLAGEQAVQRAAGDNALIVRTAWVYSGAVLPRHKDFVSTMLRLMPGPVRVVDDQTGSPTFAVDLARGLLDAARLRPRGIVHGVGGGQATWWELARETFALAGGDPGQVAAVGTADYPTPARRPQWSVLDTRGWQEVGLLPLPDWRDGLRRAVAGKLGQL